MESQFDKSVSTDVSSTETSSHRANDTPSLSQLLGERTPSTQSVVTRVRFSSSFFKLLESKMPLFGSTSGGKAGMSGTFDQTGEGASKGARSKEGADQGAMSSDPKMMLHRGSCSPIKALQVYRTPEIISPYYLVYK